MLAGPNPFRTLHVCALWVLSLCVVSVFILIHVLIAHVLCNVFNVYAHVYVYICCGCLDFVCGMAVPSSETQLH